MNWNEFLRTLVWFLTVIALIGSVVMIPVYVEGKHQAWKLVIAGVLLVIAIFGFSVIGGMNWGPAQ